MGKISDLTAITTLAEGDLAPIVDISDTLQSASGSTKKSTLTQIADFLRVRVETLTGKTLTSPKINEDVAVTSTSTEINKLHGVTADTAEINKLDGLTPTTANLNVLDGITAIDTDLSSVAATDTTLPSAKATKAYADSLGYTWKGAWVTSTSYSVNDVVRNSTAAVPGAYICLTAHTSGTFSTDLAASKWGLFIQDGNTSATTAKCRAYLGSAQDNLVDGTSTLVALDTENYDPGTNFNVTTHQFTAPITGYYSIVGSVGFGNVVTDKRYNAELRVNGDIVAYSTEVPGAASPFRLPISSIEYVVAGQTIDLYATSFSGGNTVDLIATTSSTYLCVHLLST